MDRADIASAPFRGSLINEASMFMVANIGTANFELCTLRCTTVGPVSDVRRFSELFNHSDFDLHTVIYSVRKLSKEGLGLLFPGESPEIITDDFHSCFISYSHADGEFALRLETKLRRHGIRSWLDESDMLPGDHILESVDQGLRSSDRMLLCCSEASLRSSLWVDRELAIALDKEEELHEDSGAPIGVIIPLDLDGFMFSDDWASSCRAEIRKRRAADFVGWEADQEKFDHQVESVMQALRTDR